MQVVLSEADYKFEFQLLTYTNPRGLDEDELCCEPESTVNGMCLPQATCDTQFNIYLQNFHRLERLGTNIVVGPYENTDTIMFPTCGTIDPDMRFQNPLAITFPTSEFTVRVSVWHT